jgi:Ser-tRNA(Ala) deacylase AlaX
VDELTAQELLASHRELVKEQIAMRKRQDEHIDWHHRAHRMTLRVVGTVGGLVLGAMGWGATEWRERVQADMREQAKTVAADQVRDARAEHSELRAADQRLSDRVLEGERSLQQLAMHRLETQRAMKPK